MFYRICKLLTLNIQLVFVFDGPAVPAKRGRTGGRKIDYKERDLLKQVLRCFGVPYQEAPGEAEAECARLQILGLVDAVWSQDSDCLMFGCSLWLHDDRVAKEKGSKDRSKENTKKSGKSIRIVRAKDMKDKLNLDREGLVLFAMLVGGDYHPTGLPGCGAGIALSAAKEGSLAQALCLCRNQRDCLDWSLLLAAFLQTKSRARSLRIPANFPDYKILQKYYRPKVTSDELLKGKKSLDLNTVRPIDEHTLLDVTSSRFNIWGRLYMNWVGPVLLLRSLAQRDSSLPKEVVHEIKLTKQRANKDEEVMALRILERKITFSPFGVTSLRREDFVGGNREGMWEGKKGVPFDPKHRVECDYFPAFWLQRVLPPNVLDPPPPASKQKSAKRKEQPDNGADTRKPFSPAKKKQKSHDDCQVPSSTMRSAHPVEHHLKEPRHSIASTPSTLTSAQKSTGRGTNNLATPSRPRVHQQFASKPCEVIDLSNLDDEMVLRVPPTRQSKSLSSLRESLPSVVDLGSPESSGDESEDLARAIRLSLQSPYQECEATSEVRNTPLRVRNPRRPHAPMNSAIETAPIRTDDKASSASTSVLTIEEELEQIRAARLKHLASSPTATSHKAVSEMATSRPVVAAAVDCIDLTSD
jgi:Holliday junction resolvase YEN1